MEKSLAMRLCLIVITIGFLSACGGSGSGNTQERLIYTGKEDRAILEFTNAANLVSNVIGSDDASGVIFSKKISHTHVHEKNYLQIITRFLGQQASTSSNFATINRPSIYEYDSREILDTESCDKGSVKIEGSIDDIGTGSLTFDYQDCTLGVSTLDGRVTVQINDFDFDLAILTDAVFDIDRATLSSLNSSVDFSGTLELKVTVDVGIYRERWKVDLVTLDNSTGNMTKTDNLVVIDDYDNALFRGEFFETLEGRIFDSNYGYIDLETLFPLFFNSESDPFPSQGELNLVGNNNSKIIVRGLSTTHSRVLLDLNADGKFEVSAIVEWNEFTPIAQIDLGDDDFDGIFNTWEEENNLDPFDSVDAYLDIDGDGFSNLQEYLGRSNHTLKSSVPLVADLQLTINSINQGSIGASYVYTSSVYNQGPGEARNVHFKQMLPEGVKLESIVEDPPFGTDRWDCIHLERTITCTFPSIKSKEWGSIEITFTAITNTTPISLNTVEVSSNTFDVDLSNNRVSDPLFIGDLNTGLQALIDAAVAGDTISVLPGVYTGGLDFKGKSLHLKSIEGPDTNGTYLSHKQFKLP